MWPVIFCAETTCWSEDGDGQRDGGSGNRGGLTETVLRKALLAISGSCRVDGQANGMIYFGRQTAAHEEGDLCGTGSGRIVQQSSFICYISNEAGGGL